MDFTESNSLEKVLNIYEERFVVDGRRPDLAKLGLRDGLSNTARLLDLPQIHLPPPNLMNLVQTIWTSDPPMIHWVSR